MYVWSWAACWCFQVQIGSMYNMYVWRVSKLVAAQIRTEKSIHTSIHTPIHPYIHPYIHAYIHPHPPIHAYIHASTYDVCRCWT